MNSYYIKTVLLEYWRFQRQCLCADEVGYGAFLADVLVLNKSNYYHEIEIKTVKSDLCVAELNKSKHELWKPTYPNYFSFAVPTHLVEDARIMIQKINPNYGLIEIFENQKWGNPVCFRKSAKLLHTNRDKIECWKERIIMRNSSSLIGYMKRAHCKEPIILDNKETNENL